MTYLFASFEQQIGGASAGINAKPEDRAAADRGLRGPDLAPWSPTGALHLGPARAWATPTSRRSRRRSPAASLDPASARRLLGTGVVRRGHRGAGAASTAPGWPSTASTPADASLLARAGRGRARPSSPWRPPPAPWPIPPASTRPAWPTALDEHGRRRRRAPRPRGRRLPRRCSPPTPTCCSPARRSAPSTTTSPRRSRPASSCPIGPVPVTAKALAVLRRGRHVVLPDFVSDGRPVVLRRSPVPPPPSTSCGPAVVERHRRRAWPRCSAHDDGPLLGACYRAEAFLRTWQDALPFGRPLA